MLTALEHTSLKVYKSISEKYVNNLPERSVYRNILLTKYR